MCDGKFYAHVKKQTFPVQCEINGLTSIPYRQRGLITEQWSNKNDMHKDSNYLSSDAHLLLSTNHPTQECFWRSCFFGVNDRHIQDSRLCYSQSNCLEVSFRMGNSRGDPIAHCSLLLRRKMNGRSQVLQKLSLQVRDA